MATMTLTKCDTKADAKRVVAAMRGVFPGRIVSIVDDKSMGTTTSHDVVVFTLNRPGPDTSCTSCGSSAHKASACWR